MKQLLVAILYFLPTYCISQTIAQMKPLADSIVSNIIGKQSFEANFKYNCFKSAEIFNHIYWNDCEVRTHKEKDRFEKESKKAKGKFFQITYDYLMLDTIEELITLMLDEKGNIIRLSGVKLSDKSYLISSLEINKQTAINLAKKSGFQTGLTPWKVSMTYEKIDSPEEKYYWKIENILFIGNNIGCDSQGEIIYIDALNGNYSNGGRWTISCDN